MKTCLYCQQRNADKHQQCMDCGMALPASDAGIQALRLRRFQWFCLSLALFCIAMF
ncbi:protein DnrP, partial [Pseudomonas fluorescens]